MKVKCKKCGKIFEIPKGNCPICFSDILGELSDIKDDDKRIDKLTIFINDLTNFDYERGFHNAKCVNQLEGENIILGYKFEELEELHE